MKSNFKFIPILLVFTFLNCKKDITLSEYKFSDKESVINCDGQDSKLLNEALYAFEDDINSFYKNNNNPNGNLALIYSQFLRNYSTNRINYEDLVTPHTLEVFTVLKTKNDLWDLNNTVSKLNYYGSFFNCIATNVQNQNLKSTLNALLTTHSMSARMFSSPLITQYNAASNDKYLSAYVAFDLFYAKLFDIDATKVKERELKDMNLNQNEPNVNKDSLK